MSCRFAPPAWAWAAYLPLLCLLIGLGSWQAQRGLMKERFNREAAVPAVQVDWHAGLVARLSPPLEVQVEGRLLPIPQLWLDNQSHDRRPGAHVWSLFETVEGERLMVSWGWVPLTGDRRQLEAVALPETLTRLKGDWRPLPRPGLRLAEVPCSAPAQHPQLVQYPDHATLECLLGTTVADGILLLSPEIDGPGVREWSLTAAVPPTRHYGYAAQWFMFALVLSFFFVRFNLRERNLP